MPSYRVVFFPQFRDRTKVKTKCDSVPSAENRYDHYKRSSVAPDADRRQIVKTSDPNS